MFCPNCGNELNDDDVFCSACGTRIIQQQTDSTEAVESTAPSISEPLVRKGKWKYAVVPVVIVSLAAIISAMVILFSSNPLPYGIHWGDSYAAVSSKDKHTTPPLTLTNKATNMSVSTLDLGFDYPDDAFNAILSYDFGLTDAIQSISCLITINDGYESYSDDIFSSFVEYYNRTCRRKPEVEYSQFYTWTTKDTIIKLAYYNSAIFYLAFEQIS